MSFLIYAIDHEDKDAIREQLRQAHRKHLQSAGKKLLVSGALLSDDGKTIIGGISILDTDSKQEADKFAYDDPYQKANIRKQTMVIRWRKRWIEGKFLGEE